MGQIGLWVPWDSEPEIPVLVTPAAVYQPVTHYVYGGMCYIDTTDRLRGVHYKNHLWQVPKESSWLYARRPCSLLSIECRDSILLNVSFIYCRITSAVDDMATSSMLSDKYQSHPYQIFQQDLQVCDNGVLL
jgi:hypothetical protein